MQVACLLTSRVVHPSGSSAQASSFGLALFISCFGPALVMTRFAHTVTMSTSWRAYQSDEHCMKDVQHNCISQSVDI
jgi:hypothetical protein